MNRKKILYIITKSNMGGAQRYVFELATSLSREQYDVAVACGGSGILTGKLKAAGIPVFEIKSFERDINIKNEFRSLGEIAEIIRAFRPDIVHLNSSKAGGSGALIARLLNVPHIIFTAHGWPFFEDRPFISKSIIWFLSYLTTILAHTVIVVSKHDYVHAHMPFRTHALKLVHTGIEPINFISRTDARKKLFDESTLTKHKNDIWLVSTGEHTANKNLLALIHAIEHANAKTSEVKYFLTLMGDGEERASLETYVHAHNLRESVVCTGFVDDARSYLKAFDVFALPSRKEGFPYGLLEAGAAGLACIGSNVGGIPEIIEHERTGLLIDPKDEASLVTALATLSMNAQERVQYGGALEEKVEREFSLERMFVETKTLYT